MGMVLGLQVVVGSPVACQTQVVDLEGLVREVVVVLGPGLVLMVVGLEHSVVLLMVAAEEGCDAGRMWLRAWMVVVTGLCSTGLPIGHSSFSVLFSIVLFIVCFVFVICFVFFGFFVFFIFFVFCIFFVFFILFGCSSDVIKIIHIIFYIVELIPDPPYHHNPVYFHKIFYTRIL